MKPAQTPEKLVAPDSWSELPWGEYYRDALESRLSPWWSKLFGFHLLKLGRLSGEVDSTKCAIAHQVNVGISGNNMQVIADPYHLPFADKSVDACLLAHSLSYADDPHRLLREVDRVLIDDGWMIISSFNPLSLVGLGKLLPVVRHRQPYASRMFSQMRLMDWLSLLNYEVLEQTRFQVLPWHRQGGKMLSAHLPALGCLSLIVARKRTFPLTMNPHKSRVRKAALSRAVGATKSSHNRP